MKKEILKKANELNKKISEFESALLCFEYDINEPANYHYAQIGKNLLPPNIQSTNPILIIEHLNLEEGEGRTQTKIPMVLSDCLIGMIKLAIKDNLDKLTQEFDAL